MSARALPPKHLLLVCDDLAARLRVYRGRQLEARARGLVAVETPMAEFFEAGAAAALEAFTRARGALPSPFLVACDGVAQRLDIFRRTQQHARERGEEAVELAVEELFEPLDAAALDAYEAALAELLGQRPLPMEVAS